VLAAAFDEDTATWRLTLSGGGEYEADVLIAATGQLSRPSMPEIPGLDRFEGTLFHSARCDHDHDLTGKRVAVLGTGASAIQFVPAIAGGCRSWYLTESGRNTQNWPASTLTFRRRLRRFRIEDFEPAPVSGGTRT
jgi:cation diffusion facilitator CzcD-associated flavoprotein CzcO